MSRQLDALGLQWDFIDAVDGTALSDEEVRAEAGPSALEIHPLVGRPLTRGEVGCALSHQLCYRRLSDGGESMALILEDDVRLSPAFLQVVSSLRLSRENWDVVLFAHHSERRRPTEGAEITWFRRTVHPLHRIGHVVEFPMGAMAYLLRTEAATKLLELGTPIRVPADWVVGYAPSAGMRLHAISPPCVVPERRLADATEIPGRDVPRSEPTYPLGAHVFAFIRSRVGTVLRWVRKAGVFPGSYSRNV